MSEQGETPNDTPNGSLVVPPHGRGKIRRGSLPGNPAGPGRPPSAIRESARLAYDARLDFLTKVIDGEMVEQKVQAPGAPEPLIIRRSADLNDRLAAMKELRTVGIGTLKEISSEEVRERLALTLREIQAKLPKDQAEELIARIEPHWR